MKTPQQKIEKYEAKIVELKKQIENENNPQSPDNFFLEIFNGATVKIDLEKYPNSIFYFSGETFLLEIEKQGEKLIAWFNYYKIWNPISTTNAWNYSQTQEFLTVTIEEHFKLRELTAWHFIFNKPASIEEHFKLRKVTAHRASLYPLVAIEDHFKLREVTAGKK